ncbi:serine O-acetyltransferase EpsC [Anatilimnocola floriformis]|uniref:serine O-acetyltransferase EpsC n=1 Tax=Anatilimnocola floriformis TaxID=2948575 RepID=UPI0020C28ABE|nr:serine O-acetyltransferase EpsC [Anatilimnocola floriformis]
MTSATEEIQRRPREANWNISGVVAELGKLRNDSLASRQRTEEQTKMPSRKALIEIIDGLSITLFPNRLGRSDLTGEGVDYFVAHTLDLTLRDLFDQVLLELQYAAALEGLHADQRSRASQITREFAARLPAVRKLLESDLRAAYEGDPAARSEDEVLVCYPGITAICNHRLAHNLFVLGAPLVARMIAEISHSVTGIDIHPGAQIQGSFFIDHGTGVVIGETAIIGQRVRLYQAVTLGAKRFPKDEQGILIKGAPRHPIVEDDVVVYAGATILGRITIGRGSSIGGNVWLTQSVPPGSNITQAKVRSDVFDGGGGI